MRGTARPPPIGYLCLGRSSLAGASAPNAPHWLPAPQPLPIGRRLRLERSPLAASAPAAPYWLPPARRLRGPRRGGPGAPPLGPGARSGAGSKPPPVHNGAALTARTAGLCWSNKKSGERGSGGFRGAALMAAAAQGVSAGLRVTCTPPARAGVGHGDLRGSFPTQESREAV